MSPTKSKGLLPTTLPRPPSPGTNFKGHAMPRPGLPKRYTRLFLALFISLVFLFSLHPKPSYHTQEGYPAYPTTLEQPPADWPTYTHDGKEEFKPALFERYTRWEEEVSEMVSVEDSVQALVDARGGEQKYLYLANHQRYAGWGNAMQEMLLNVYLTWESGRGFVYDNYTWDINGPAYSDWNGRLRPSRIPLSTMLGGPIVGFPFSPSSSSSPSHSSSSLSPQSLNYSSNQVSTIDPTRLPRSISKTHFHEICKDEIEYIDADKIRATLPQEVTAGETVRAWVDHLKSLGRCVEVLGGSAQLFDIWIMGSSRAHDVYPSIAHSPVLKQFKWSPLIHRMFLKNLAYFVDLKETSPGGWFPDFIHSSSLSQSPSTPEEKYTNEFLEREKERELREGEKKGNVYGSTPTPSSLPIMALHLRRGDFSGHCEHLAEWSSTYTGFNTLPGLPDSFNSSTYPRESEEYRNAYQRHCWPDTQDVVRVVRGAVVDWVKAREVEWMSAPLWRRVLGLERKREMRKVYIMTNGDPTWLAQLKSVLLTSASDSLNPTSPTYLEWQGVKWSWDAVFSSRDLSVGWEEKHVSQALDMYLGERAEVFVGNGFSSLTANVVLLRMGRGVGAGTRFW